MRCRRPLIFHHAALVAALTGASAGAALIQLAPLADDPRAQVLIAPRHALAVDDLTAPRPADDPILNPGALVGITARSVAPSRPTNLPPQAAAALKRARIFLSGGNLDGVREAANEVLAADPGNPDALLLRGAADAKTGGFQSALEDFDRVVKSAPDDPAAHHSRGLALKELGRTQEAEDAFSRALRLDPAFAEAYLKRGLLRAAGGRFEPALSDFDTYVDLRPDDPLGYRNRAAALLRLGRKDEAIPDIRRVRSLQQQQQGL